jgi:hypothetical protein
MTNYTTQLINLRAAHDALQDVINITDNQVNKGKMYAAQDIITAQIQLTLALEAEQDKAHNDNLDYLRNPIADAE